MLTKRQEDILKCIVEEYTKSAQPVGSRTIKDTLAIDASPATIRNDCVVLEKEGYLEKEHLSSGRIPSTKGYRYYVDNLMDTTNIDDIKTRIEALFSNRNLTVVEVLDKTAKILSEMTHLTSVVMGPNITEESLVKIELLPISEDKVVIVFILSNGHVENKLFNIEEKIELTDLQISIDLFNNRLKGTKLGEITSKFDLIRPILERQVKQHEYILKQFISALTSIVKPTYTTHGIQYMLQNPEYNDPNRIKQIISFIETISPFEYFQKNTEDDKKVKIQIGNETGFNNDDVALLTTTYKLDDAVEGSIALVGPKRIEYDKVYEVLEWLAMRLQEFYNK